MSSASAMEVRRMETDDIPGYAELYNMAEANDPEFRHRTMKEMEKSIFMKATDTLDGYFVATEAGRIVAGGGGYVTRDKAGVGMGHLALYILPDFLDSEAEREVFVRIINHQKAIGASTIGARVNTTNESRTMMLERQGFRKNEYQRHHMERCPMGLPEPIIPHGFTLRNARMPEEMGQLLDTINAAYSTRKGFGVQTLEEISTFPYLTNPEFLPGLFVMERDADGMMVGMVGSQIEHVYNQEHGRKRGSSYSLMVIPSERGRGIGRALMTASLRWIESKDMDVAYLGVNHRNPDALHLYKSLGYELVGIWQGYEREI